MKKYVLFAAIGISAGFGGFRLVQPKLTQAEITMCGMDATPQFAGFANDPSFIKKHLAPLPFQDYSPKGTMMEFTTPDGSKANAYFLKSANQSNEYLFVIHEWWGLNNYVKQESDRFWETYANINVIALDMYDGKVATSPDDAGKYMQAMSTDRAKAIIKGALTFAGSDAKIFTLGWCFGGGWSLQSSIELGDQAAGAILFYGMPETDLVRLGTLKCDVLGLFATNDQWINPGVVSKFEADMKSLGKNLKVKSYDADHAFANPSNPKYNKEASENAYKLVSEFIKARR